MNNEPLPSICTTCGNEKKLLFECVPRNPAIKPVAGKSHIMRCWDCLKSINSEKEIVKLEVSDEELRRYQQCIKRQRVKPSRIPKKKNMSGIRSRAASSGKSGRTLGGKRQAQKDKKGRK